MINKEEKKKARWIYNNGRWEKATDEETINEIGETSKQNNNISSEDFYKEKLEEIRKKISQEVEEDAPKMEDKYSYGWSKWGFVDEKIAQDINKRYKEGKTILHIVTQDTKRKDYVEAVVALIKMGANTTLRDNDRKTPIDYVPNDRINEVYQNLKTTLRRYEAKAVGLRVLRAMVEIEENKHMDNKESSRETYFRALEAFVKNNYKKKTKEDMENILSIHVYEDENIGLRAQKEKYFTHRIDRNTEHIECAQGFFKTNNLDFEGLTDKSTKFKDNMKTLNEIYNEYLLSFNNAYEENKMLRNYILKNSNVKFRELKQDVMDSLKILSFVQDKVVRNDLETYLEKMIAQHPTLINEILSNENEVIEKIGNNLKVSVEDNVKSDGKLGFKMQKTIRTIKEYIDENHFNQIMLKIANISKKGNPKEITDSAQNFLKDYKEYLLGNQPRSVRDAIDKQVKKTDILEAVINAGSKRVLEALINNGRNINEYMLNGKLPIELAINNNNETMVQALLDLGTEINLFTKNNVTVLELLKEKMPNICEKMDIMGDNETLEQMLETRNTEVAKQIILKNELDITEELKSYVEKELNEELVKETGKSSEEKALIIEEGDSDIEEDQKDEQLIRTIEKFKEAGAKPQALLPMLSEYIKVNEKKAIKFAKALSEEENLKLITADQQAREYIKNGEFQKVGNILKENRALLENQKENQYNLILEIILKAIEMELCKKDNSLDKEALEKPVLIMELSPEDIAFNEFEKVIKENSEILNNVDLIVNREDNTTPLHYIMGAISKGKKAQDILDVVLKYVNNYDVLDVKDNAGMTALDCAIYLKNNDTIKSMFKRNMELKKELGLTAENIVHFQYALLNETTTKEELERMINLVIGIMLPNGTEDERKIKCATIINNVDVPTQQTLLHIAAGLGKKGIVDYLLSNNPNLVLCDKDGLTALMYAAKGGNINIIRDIINKSKAIKETDLLNAKDCFGRTALNYALMTGNIRIISEILQGSKDIEEIIDNKARNIMHYAVGATIENRNIDILKIASKTVENKGVLEKIAYESDFNNRTFLHYAAMSRSIGILDYFLKDKALNLGLEKRDEMGKTAVDYLLSGEIRDDEKEIIREMINRFDDSKDMKNVLYSACCNDINPDKAVKMVLDAFTYKKDGKPTIKVERLLKSLEPSEVDNDGKTALDVALQNEKLSDDMFCELIEKSEIKNDKAKKALLVEKLVANNKRDLAEKLNLTSEYDNDIRIKNPNKLYQMLKNMTDAEIRGYLRIDDNIDTTDFKLYDYAIVKDNVDWYNEFIQHEQTPARKKIKERVIEYNSTNILQELLNKGQNFNEKRLCENAQKDAIKLILDHYKDDDSLKEAIIKAANETNITIVQKAIKHINKHINGLLHIAALNNSVELAKVVLNTYGKKELEQKDENGKTAYDIALENDNIEMITYLILNGAKVKYIEKISDTLTANETLLNEQIKCVEERMKIVGCDEQEYKDKLSKLTRYEINKEDHLGNTLLYYAIKMNNVKKVKYLIAKGADINVKNKYKESPLYLSIKSADKELVEELIENRANIAEEVKGKSMLHYAMKRKTQDNKKEIEERKSVAMQLMKKRIVDLTPSTMNETIIYNGESITQLMYHIMKSNKDVAYTLINAKEIDLNVTDTEGKTVYGYALNKRYKDLIEVIEQKEPNIKKDEKIIKDVFGVTDSQTAIKGTIKGIKWLLEKGKTAVENTNPLATVFGVAQLGVNCLERKLCINDTKTIDGKNGLNI